MELFQNDSARKGLDEELTLLCTNCQNSSIFHTSNYFKYGGRRLEVNIRLIEGVLETGNGQCSFLDLPPPVSIMLTLTQLTRLNSATVLLLKIP